jgi:predicted nucleic acid-binding protein
MIAVSNTTPLRYLIAIRQEQLLSQLFERILLPPAVQTELLDPKAPDIVRNFVKSLPPRFEVKAPDGGRGPLPAALHRGEREAILLAETVQADALLIDEQFGRSVAFSRSLPVIGTLGLLERADLVGIIPDFPQTLRELKSSGFYISQLLEQSLLTRHATRDSK